jgi:hypothetical protein
MKSILLEMSYGMLYETKFPENLFHEITIFSRNVIDRLSSIIKLENFSLDHDLIKNFHNFIIICLINTKYGIFEDKLNSYNIFLNFVMMEHGINLTTNNFLFKQIDFFLLNENRGLCKNMINNPVLVTYITSTIKEYITELKYTLDSISANNNNNNNSLDKRKSSLKRMSTMISTNQNIVNFGHQNTINNNKQKNSNLNNNINNNNQSNAKLDKLELEILDLVLKAVSTLLKYNTTTSFSQFIRENGVVMIIELCGIKVFDFETSKLIVKILQKFSSEGLFKVSSQYFKK